MKGWKLIAALVVFTAAAVGGWKWLYAEKEEADSDAAKQSLVATAERRDIESSMLLTGEVEAVSSVQVKAEVGGPVKKIAVEVGQTVQKGDLLAVIDDTDLKTNLTSAQTTVDGAKLALEKTQGNYDRAKALYEQKLISKEVFMNLQADLAIAQNALDKANSQLQTVKDQLNKTRILAPSDGTVLDIPVTEGQVVVAAASVNAGTLLMDFADLSRLLINANVNQMDAPRLKLGLPVDVNFADISDVPVKAHIEFIAPIATVKNNIKGFEVHALIDDNDGRLKPGMSVSMHVPVGQASHAISVPVAAIFRERRSNVVYVRKGDGEVERRKVNVGLTDLSYAQILSGLSEGEEILLAEPGDTPSKS